jgi:hypothetical protein
MMQKEVCKERCVQFYVGAAPRLNFPLSKIELDLIKMKPEEPLPPPPPPTLPLAAPFSKVWQPFFSCYSHIEGIFLVS